MAIGDLEPSTRRHPGRHPSCSPQRASSAARMSPRRPRCHGPRCTATSGSHARPAQCVRFALYEQDNFDAGIARRWPDWTARATGCRAAVRRRHRDSYSLGSIVDIRPEHVLGQMKRVLPIMHETDRRVIPGSTRTSRRPPWCGSRCATTWSGRQSGRFPGRVAAGGGLDPRQANIRRETDERADSPGRSNPFVGFVRHGQHRADRGALRDLSEPGPDQPRDLIGTFEVQEVSAPSTNSNAEPAAGKWFWTSVSSSTRSRRRPRRADTGWAPSAGRARRTASSAKPRIVEFGVEVGPVGLITGDGLGGDVPAQFGEVVVGVAAR